MWESDSEVRVLQDYGYELAAIKKYLVSKDQILDKIYVILLRKNIPVSVHSAYKDNEY